MDTANSKDIANVSKQQHEQHENDQGIQGVTICFPTSHENTLNTLDGIEQTSQVPAHQQHYPQFTLLNINTVEYAVPAELQFVDYLGGGNYGNVIKVRTTNGIELAVKKMYEPFSHEVKARRVYRELKLLQLINHGNIIRFVNMYTPDRDFRSFKNVYIVSAYAGISLKQVLDRQKQLGIRMINFDHVKYLIYQLLRALKYLHSANVIHRDLKPSNLAITEECDLTVLDFGLARTVSNNTDNLTAYVISRWYRSPEVIYWNNVSYNAKADVWSVGCILAELLTQKVLFPGSEAMEQYKLIIRLCGSPDEELMNKIEQQNSPAMRMVIERMSGNCERKVFRRVFVQYPMDAVDLLDRLLVLDPDRRISVEEALQHPYMQDYHLPEDEPVAKQPFSIEDNDTTKTLNDWKEIVWKELQMHSNNVQQQQKQHISSVSASDYTSLNCSVSDSPSLIASKISGQEQTVNEHMVTNSLEHSLATTAFSALSTLPPPVSPCHSRPQHTTLTSASLTPVANITTEDIIHNDNTFASSSANITSASWSSDNSSTVLSHSSRVSHSTPTTFVPAAANIFPPSSVPTENIIVVNGSKHTATSPPTSSTLSPSPPSVFRQCSSI